MKTYKQFISICEQVSAYGQLRYGSTPAKATDKSVSSAVDRALSNPNVLQSASSEKGKTGVSGSVDVQYSGRFGSRPKPQSTATKPELPTPRPPSATRFPTPRPPSATRLPTPRPPSATNSVTRLPNTPSTPRIKVWAANPITTTGPNADGTPGTTTITRNVWRDAPRRPLDYRPPMPAMPGSNGIRVTRVPSQSVSAPITVTRVPPSQQVSAPITVTRSNAMSRTRTRGN